MYRYIFAAPLLCMPLSAAAQDSSFETPAPHVLIMDHETGIVLYEKNARAPMAPASMTKIMTAELVFEKLRSGQITLDTEFPVSEEAWRRGGAKSGSSTMFLKLGSTARVEDLLRGVIIQSGNDACIVLAEGISGSETAFADEMTKRARELGLESATFRNATGWPHSDHKISTVDLAKLAQNTIDTYPEFYSIYAEREFTWNGITQGNRNPLLGRFTGADGLKTGHTEASGYGLVASAKRGNDRRIVVVNGLDSKAQRSNEGNRLMRAAFESFKIYNLFAAGDELGRVDVYMGQEDSVAVKIDEDVRIGLFRGDRKNLKTQMRYTGSAVAPVKMGDHIADLIVIEPSGKNRIIPLKAAADVKAKSAFAKTWNMLLRKIRGT